MLQKMDSIEKQEAELLRELNSRSKAKVTLESALYVLIVLFLFVGNSLTLLVILLNRRMRTIPNMLVASLAVSDLFIGVFSADPLAIPTLVTSHWPFNDTTCQFQGYLASGLCCASIHTLVLMAVNRYHRIDKVPTLLHQEENPYHDTCDMVLLSLRSTNLRATWEQNGLSSFKVLLLYSNQKQCIFGIWYSALHRDSNPCYNLLLLKNLFDSSPPQYQFSSAWESNKHGKRRRSGSHHTCYSGVFLICAGFQSSQLTFWTRFFKDGSSLPRLIWHIRFWGL